MKLLRELREALKGKILNQNTIQIQTLITHNKYMPNFCENNLRVRGDQKELKSFSEKLKQKNIFTLEKLVPTPASFLKKAAKNGIIGE